MITFNAFDLAAYIIGALAIWALTPEDYRQEIGLLVGILFQILWLILCIGFLLILGYNIVLIKN